MSIRKHPAYADSMTVRRFLDRSAFLRRLSPALLLPLGVSAVTVGFGFLITLARPPLALTRSWWILPLAQAVVAVPLVVRTLLPALRAIDPRQREAAAALGAGPGRVLLTVDGPQLLRAGGLAAGFALATGRRRRWRNDPGQAGKPRISVENRQ